jgi:TetR/AcrR family transcriptional repressor of nem operon
MARTQEFDRNEVLQAAMTLFWSKGYEATSLADLLQATGLSKSSLYASFGDKRSFFLEAFELYRKQRLEYLDRILNAGPSALQALKNVLWQIALQAMQTDDTYGCMVANEAVELGPHDADIQQLVLADFQEVEERFYQTLLRAQVEGSVSVMKDARGLARFMIVTLQGIQVMARANSDRDRLIDSVKLMLSLLD